jgi:hypothetical protein
MKPDRKTEKPEAEKTKSESWWSKLEEDTNDYFSTG